jgi:hypothetical protein
MAVCLSCCAVRTISLPVFRFGVDDWADYNSVLVGNAQWTSETSAERAAT